MSVAGAISVSSIYQKVKAVAEKFKADVIKVADATPAIVAKVEADAPEVEALVGLAFPQAAAAEKVILTVFDAVAAAVESAGTAAGSNALNVQFDQAVIAAVKAVIADLKAAKV